MKVFFRGISEDNTCSRAERERSAVDCLVKEAFGEKAVKTNLATGAPVITVEGRAVDTAFSISHCEGLAALAVAKNTKAIGVDVEKYRAQLRRVSCRFLTAAEAAVYSSDEALLAAWTLKEATYKAALTPGLALCDIELPADGSKVIHAVGKEFEILHCAKLEDSDVWMSVVGEK